MKLGELLKISKIAFSTDERCIDIGNEDLRAQVKKLQYEVDHFAQERNYINLQHEKELREVLVKTEAEYKRAQVGRLCLLCYMYG